MKIICCDLDDTIADTSTTILKFVDEYHHKVLNRETNSLNNVQSDDCYYFLKKYEWSDKEIEGFFECYYPDYLLEVRCNPFAGEVINKLRENGFKIHIVSARPEFGQNQVYKITEKWLKDNGISFDNLIIDTKNKLPYVRSSNSDIFIDDSFENCTDVLCGANCEKILLFSTKHNKDYNSNGITRIFDWKSLYSVVTSGVEEVID